MTPAPHDKNMLTNHLAEIKVLKQRISKLESIKNDLNQAEEKTVHLNAVLRAIHKVHQLIISENDIDRLLKGICNNL